MKPLTSRVVISGVAGAAVGLMLASAAPLAADAPAAGGSATRSEMKHDVHHGSLEERIAGAKSAHDHEMLAADFESAAKDLDNQAIKHERMGKAYTAFPGKAPAGSMAIHCDAIAKNFREAAAQNRDLAKFHREQARTTQ